jgi:hypothetical protein
VIIIGVAVVVLRRSNATTTREEAARHEACARAMGGRVVEPFREGEVACYAGTAGGIEWTLRVASMDDPETSRKTTLIWETESIRCDHVLAIVGNDVNTGESAWSQIAGAGYRLDVDPTADFEREAARRGGITGQPPPVVAFGQSAHEVKGVAGLPPRFRVFADDDGVAEGIVTRDVISAVSRWHAGHQGLLRIWAGGPDLRFIATEIDWPSPEGFRDVLGLGMLLAQNMSALLNQPIH